MALDPSVALQVKPIDMDLSKPMNALAQYQMAGAHANLYNQQARIQELKLAALQQVGHAMSGGDDDAVQDAIGRVGMVDPEAGKVMQDLHQKVRIAKWGNQNARNGVNDPSTFNAVPDVAQTVTDTLSKQDTNTRANTLQRLKLGGSLANKYIANPTPQAWNEGLGEMERSGLFTAKEIQDMRNEPPEKHMKHALSMQAGEQEGSAYMQNSGVAQGNQPKAVPKTEDLLVPNPSNPLAAGNSGNPPTSQDEAKALQEKDPRYQEVPKVDLGNGTARPGTLNQGQDPTILTAKNESMAHYNKEIVPQGNAAGQQRAELGTIRSQLQSGKISTGILAKLKETVSQFIYEGSKLNGKADPKLAQDLTGINPETSDIMNKSSTRLGFDMARTQGAREAVQVIQFALSANPNMLNTKEGALKLTELLDKTAEWHQDRQDYAGKYFAKNGHIVNFDSWHNNNHPIQQYTSQAVPYQMPPTKDKLQDGVTYEDKKGEKWKWDAKADHYAPVE